MPLSESRARTRSAPETDPSHTLPRAAPCSQPPPLRTHPPRPSRVAGTRREPTGRPRASRAAYRRAPSYPPRHRPIRASRRRPWAGRKSRTLGRLFHPSGPWATARHPGRRTRPRTP